MTNISLEKQATNRSKQLIKGKIEIASTHMKLSVLPVIHEMQIKVTISPSVGLPNSKNNNLLFDLWENPTLSHSSRKKEKKTKNWHHKSSIATYRNFYKRKEKRLYF